MRVDESSKRVQNFFWKTNCFLTSTSCASQREMTTGHETPFFILYNRSTNSVFIGTDTLLRRYFFARIEWNIQVWKINSKATYHKNQNHSQTCQCSKIHFFSWCSEYKAWRRVFMPFESFPLRWWVVNYLKIIYCKSNDLVFPFIAKLSKNFNFESFCSFVIHRLVHFYYNISISL
mgnify:CR=1 FL=1